MSVAVTDTGMPVTDTGMLCHRTGHQGLFLFFSYLFLIINRIIMGE
jgi:hypothetical protein